MEQRRPIRHELYERFSYGAFDRAFTIALVLILLYGALEFVPPKVSMNLPNIATAGLFALCTLLFGWFALVRNTVFVVDGHGIRAVAFGLTRKRISWSAVTRVTETSIGRGMTTVKILSGGIVGRPRTEVSIISDLNQYSSLKHILRDQSEVFGFSEACQLSFGQASDVSKFS